jgi:hypothetical protein
MQHGNAHLGLGRLRNDGAHQGTHDIVRAAVVMRTQSHCLGKVAEFDLFFDLCILSIIAIALSMSSLVSIARGHHNDRC